MTGPSAVAREGLGHVDALYNYARRMTRNAADADELVQETYARALAGAHTFTGGSLKAWLFRILRNAFIDSHRRHQQPLLGELDVVDGAVDGRAWREDIDGYALRGLVAGEIDAALATLSVEGLTEGEMAEVIGCPLGTIKSRLSRARALLRERLREYAPPAPRRQNVRSETDDGV